MTTIERQLNLQNIAAGPSVGNLPGVNQFLSPAEEIVKNDAAKPNQQETTADYFKTADFIPNMPSMAMNNSIQLGIPENAPQTNYSAELSLQKIRDTVLELKAQGAKIHVDEMNFENSYQIIIKLDK